MLCIAPYRVDYIGCIGFFYPIKPQVGLSCHHSQLSSIKSLRGRWDKTGLTDPTKWLIMSHIRNFRSQKDLKCYYSCSPGSVGTHMFMGEVVKVGFEAVQRVEWWFLPLISRKEEDE